MGESSQIVTMEATRYVMAGSSRFVNNSSPMDKQSFGARIASLRSAAGLSQDNLASRMGYKVTSRLGNYESGRNWPPIDHLDKLASELGVEVADLFATEDTAGSAGRGERGVMPATLPGHTMVWKLDGFEKPQSQDRIAIPDAVIRRRVPHGVDDSIRWMLNPSTAMSPRIPKDALVLVDTSQDTLVQVVDGEIYAIKLWGRPDVRRIYVTGEDSIRLVGERPTDQRVELTAADYSKLEIGGLVIDAI